MCGRVVQASSPLRYAFVDGLSVPDSRVRLPMLDLLRWGLIPHGMHGP